MVITRSLVYVRGLTMTKLNQHRAVRRGTGASRPLLDGPDLGRPLRKRGQNVVLRYFIDWEGGVTIDDCERFSRAVDRCSTRPIPSRQSYCLEVSSRRRAELTRDGILKAPSAPSHGAARPPEGRRARRVGALFCPAATAPFHPDPENVELLAAKATRPYIRCKIPTTTAKEKDMTTASFFESLWLWKRKRAFRPYMVIKPNACLHAVKRDANGARKHRRDRPATSASSRRCASSGRARLGPLARDRPRGQGYKSDVQIATSSRSRSSPSSSAHRRHERQARHPPGHPRGRGAATVGRLPFPKQRDLVTATSLGRPRKGIVTVEIGPVAAYLPSGAGSPR
jgi:hypothetical protein